MNKPLSNIVSGTEPLYMQIYRQLLCRIQNKSLKSGDKLPADMIFARELGINHLTLKKALNRLAAEGFLLRTRGKGTFVADDLPPLFNCASGKRVAMIYDMVCEESFHGDIFLSIYKAVGELGLSMELISANNSRTTQFKQTVSLFSDPESAGCIVWSIMDMRQLEHLAAAKPENYPLIFINHKPELDIQGIDFSGYDDFGSGRKLGEYINSSGVKRSVICQSAVFRKKTTNTNRIAGLQSSLNCPAEIFHGYDNSSFEKLKTYLQNLPCPEQTAVVFICDADYPPVAEVLTELGITPFVFFTGLAPCCRGIQLSTRIMGENSVKILAARRNGDDSFAISKRICGTIV